MEAFFSCFPAPSGCEWHPVLRAFTAEYNRVRETDYQHEACLDRLQQPRKEPEVLLVSSSRRPMVVERKTIVWPSNFLHVHSKSHNPRGRGLADQLISGLRESSRLPITVSVCSAHLGESTNRVVDAVAAQIISEIEEGASRGIVRFQGGQMPWTSYGGVPFAPEGTRINVLDDEPGSSLYEDPQALLDARAKQVAGFRSRLEEELLDVEKKFDHYPDHLRVFLAQFVGDTSALLEEEDLPSILAPALGSSFVDETWIATKNWISQDDFGIIWVPYGDGT